MDARAAHLLALVEGGATLEQAGRVYGLRRERVRQILKEEGAVGRLARSKDRQGPVSLRPAVPRGLGLAVEALWRGGMLLREVAEALAVPRAVARELLCERVSREQRVARTADRFDGRDVPVEQMLDALRDAADVIGRTPSRCEYERLRGQGLLEGPAAGTISHRLGWERACELSGLFPPGRSDKESRRPVSENG